MAMVSYPREFRYFAIDQVSSVTSVWNGHLPASPNIFVGIPVRIENSDATVPPPTTATFIWP